MAARTSEVKRSRTDVPALTEHEQSHEDQFCLMCVHCSKRCAVDAKFCSGCGRKLRLNAFGELRSKLPSLDKYTSLHRSSLLSPTSRPPTVLKQRSRLDVEAETKKKRALPMQKPPARIAKLETTSVEVLSSAQAAAATELQMELKLKTWMASTRRLVELLLELKRRFERPESEMFDEARLNSSEAVIQGLEAELHKFDSFFACDRNLQAKCVAMLLKVKNLHGTVAQHADGQRNPDHLVSTSMRDGNPRAHHQHRDKVSAFHDAEVVIRGPDGKRIYFKSSRSHSPSRSIELVSTASEERVERASAMCVPHSQPKHIQKPTSPEVPARSHLRVTQFLRTRFPMTLLVRVTRVGRFLVFLRVEENEDLHQLDIHIYQPLTSSSWTINMPLEWLAFILPPVLTWYRASEIRRYRAIEQHWGRCFDYVHQCLKWKRDGSVHVSFPVQFRVARMFSFRSFATFYGLLSVHAMPPDYALKLVFVNARTNQRTMLLLEETHIVRCFKLGSEYRERLVGYTTRRALYAQVCERLFFEYTSRGFELLFPGVKPKGTVRRHPDELSIVQRRADDLEQEREQLRLVRSECIKQTVAIARRRQEQYHERMRRQRREKKEAAAKKIQARTRDVVGRRKRRKAREEQRRVSRVQDLAATLIQHQYRMRREKERQRRQRVMQQQELYGTRFRVCGRINHTFAMAIVTLDEIDTAANAFDCGVEIMHPSTLQTATLRVAHSDLLRLLGVESFRGISRRLVVDALVHQHLDVFRSAKYNVLVIGIRSSSSKAI